MLQKVAAIDQEVTGLVRGRKNLNAANEGRELEAAARVVKEKCKPSYFLLTKKIKKKVQI